MKPNEIEQLKAAYCALGWEASTTVIDRVDDADLMYIPPTSLPRWTVVDAEGLEVGVWDRGTADALKVLLDLVEDIVDGRMPVEAKT